MFFFFQNNENICTSLNSCVIPDLKKSISLPPFQRKTHNVQDRRYENTFFLKEKSATLGSDAFLKTKAKRVKLVVSLQKKKVITFKLMSTLSQAPLEYLLHISETLSTGTALASNELASIAKQIKDLVIANPAIVNQKVSLSPSSSKAKSSQLVLLHYMQPLSLHDLRSLNSVWIGNHRYLYDYLLCYGDVDTDLYNSAEEGIILLRSLINTFLGEDEKLTHFLKIVLSKGLVDVNMSWEARSFQGIERQWVLTYVCKILSKFKSNRVVTLLIQNGASILEFAFDKGLISITEKEYWLQERNAVQKAYQHSDRNKEQVFQKLWLLLILPSNFLNDSKELYESIVTQVKNTRFRREFLLTYKVQSVVAENEDNAKYNESLPIELIDMILSYSVEDHNDVIGFTEWLMKKFGKRMGIEYSPLTMDSNTELPRAEMSLPETEPKKDPKNTRVITTSSWKCIVL
ncbi:hypothetical protein RFI_21083 [Reticulomyxa filosa]|uniref:Uncharacterized protein n=1 Tax=Reticulomyxa filosa TaxID=46433 RepID=X6MQI5_RETFI|nr:hypothetical protein RFI_21083 [Reticulomyxa filosa]|eukprot:ETO16268.1 hypothetical protein RFI_21083 [Reticulomyxa filosa]